MDIFDHPDIERMAEENDYEGLYKCLANRDKVIRLEAAEALADLGDDKGWRFLFDAVKKYDDPDFQATAAAMLGELGDPRAVPALAEALKKTKGEVADTVRDALESIPGPEAEGALRQAGYEPVLPLPSTSGVTEYEVRYVRPVLPHTDRIQYLSADEHINNAVDLRESEITERAMVEASLALWLKPDWAYAWYIRGVLMEDLERAYEAVLAYRHAVELDPTLKDAREGLDELSEETPTTQDVDLLMADLSVHHWETRRNAAAGLGDLAMRGDPAARQAVDLLIDLVQDEEREVRHAAIEALGWMGDRRAVLPLINLEESSWLVRFAILQSLSQLGSVDGLVTVLRREMSHLQERNPVFSSQKDPLLEVEYDRLMEIGVRALERTGSIEALLQVNEENTWEDVGTDDDESYGADTQDVDDLAALDEGSDEDEEAADEDLASYVDEVAEMAAAALDRLATARLAELPVNILQRLVNVPDLTLIDLSNPVDDSEQESEPVVVYDLSPLREAAKKQLAQHP